MSPALFPIHRLEERSAPERKTGREGGGKGGALTERDSHKVASSAGPFPSTYATPLSSPARLLGSPKHVFRDQARFWFWPWSWLCKTGAQQPAGEASAAYQVKFDKGLEPSSALACLT